MINNRRNKWYKPNPRQPGFRPGQGCLIQSFAIYLLMEYANVNNKDVFLGLLPFEKAFDFCNRVDLLTFLMKNNAGDRFVKTLARMYIQTSYVPKINNNRNFNVKTFHDWMDVNIENPFFVKIKVLYSRVFAAITYGCEAWFSIDMVAEKLLKIERSLLKRILCVKVVLLTI